MMLPSLIGAANQPGASALFFMTPVAIVALYAGSLNPHTAWMETEGWRHAPAAVLAGVNGAAVDPASVRARWNDEWIVFEFTCKDAQLVSPGHSDGIDHFVIGDAVEIFLGRAGDESYSEIHATPAGRKTLYRMSGYRAREPAPASLLSAVKVRSERAPGGWRSIICIPWDLVGGSPRRGPWNVLAGRYDYGPLLETPALSSFPPQSGKPDFHARARWARLELKP